MFSRRQTLAAMAAVGLPIPAFATGRAPIPATAAGLLDNYSVPDWYRDAKLGIWAHWGPQCAPESGDWYGRHMYLEDNWQGRHFRQNYGHPADVGFVDVIAAWKAEKWNPDAVFGAYAKAGARFLVAMACHHDNLDLFQSRHSWNSTRIGPRKDVVSGWARAARKLGLPFGVSNHASHAWHWWQTAYGYDTVGPRKGERYDAFHRTLASGKGKAWDGLDPQALYTGPRQVPPEGLESPEAMRKWHDENSGQWVETAPPGDLGYAMHWLARQFELVERYQPDFLYQDGYNLPFGEIGVMAAAHFYNQSILRTGGMNGVMTAGFTEGQGTLVNLERKVADTIRPDPWQTATCIGDWHYNRGRFNEKSYVPAAEVIRQLADVVSKNGTLLLSVPVRGDGTLDSEETAILNTLGKWMAREGESAIYGSRPWRVYGQEDGGGVRYTARGGSLYAILLDPKPGTLLLSDLKGVAVEKVTLVGGGKLDFSAGESGLSVRLTENQTSGIVPVLEIKGGALV